MVEKLVMTRDEIINTLRQNIVELSFTKVKDGEVRNMTATLEQGYIPEEKMPKSGSVDQSVGGESTCLLYTSDAADE